MFQLAVLTVIRINSAVIRVLVEIAICAHYLTRCVEHASAILRRRNRKRVFIFLRGKGTPKTAGPSAMVSKKTPQTVGLNTGHVFNSALADLRRRWRCASNATDTSETASAGKRTTVQLGKTAQRQGGPPYIVASTWRLTSWSFLYGSDANAERGRIYIRGRIIS